MADQNIYHLNCETTRKIYVLHIRSYHSAALKIDDQANTCTSKDFLNYHISYRFILGMHPKLGGTNVPYIKEEIESFSTKLIEDISTTPLRCVAILVVIEPMYKFIFDYFPVELYNIITVYNLVKDDSDVLLKAMKPLKIRNLIYNSETEVLRINETDVVFGRHFWNRTDNLGCIWWFKYYLSNVFLCATNRLRQYSQTCYVNAVLNGFIMSESTRKQILLSIRKMNPETIASIQEPIELRSPALVCIDYKNEIYFFRLFYNAICRKQNFTDTLYQLNLPENTDFFKHFFTQRGFSLTIIISMLKFLAQSEIINIQPSVADPPFDWNPNSAFLVKKMWEDIKTSPIPFEYTFQDVLFDIEFAVLFVIADSQNQDKNHILLAYRCNGVCKIYDSNNFFYDFNWQNPTDEEVDNFLENLNSIYKVTYQYLYTELILFIRNDIKSELSDLKIPDLCNLLS